MKIKKIILRFFDVEFRKYFQKSVKNRKKLMRGVCQTKFFFGFFFEKGNFKIQAHINYFKTFLISFFDINGLQITWYRNDEIIEPGARLSFVNEGSFFCVEVAPVTVDDQGHWTCMAENLSGRSSCTCHLNILGKNNLSQI